MGSRTLKSVALFGLSFLIAAVAIVLVTPPAEHYELSLYAAYPWYFWGLVVAAAFVGALVIVGSGTLSDDRSWMFGLLIVLLSNALVLLMPHIRGYQMYGRFDGMSHIGFVQNIIAAGGFGGNIYPPIHVVALAVATATGTDPMTVALWVPPVFSVVYFGAMFYLLAYLFDSRERILFGLPFAMLPVLRNAFVGFRPFDASLLLLPLVLYLFVRSQREPVPSVRAPFVVVLVALLLYHPLTALFVVLIAALYLGAKHLPRVSSQHATPTNILSLSAAVFLAWYFQFTGIILRLDNIYVSLFGFDQGGAPINTYTKTVNEASPALTDLIRVATFKYGLEFVLFGLGLAFVGFALLLLVTDEYVPDTYAALFSGVLVVFSFGGAVFLLKDLIVPPDRAFQVGKIVAVVLAGQLFYLLWYSIGRFRDRTGLRTAFRVSLTVGLLLLVTLSVFSLYPSPLASSANSQVTEMEIDGTRWLMEHGSEADQLVEFQISYERFYHARNGVEQPEPFEGRAPPNHFNYTEHEYAGASYAEDKYLTINRYGRVVYPQGFPDYREKWRFTPADYDRLERDRTVARVYDNGDYNLYLIEGTRTTGT